MNGIDLLILVILVVAAWHGLERGLLRAAGSLAGTLVGLWFASEFYIPLSNFLGETIGIKGLLAKILIPFLAGAPAQPAVPPVPPESGFPPSLWMPLLGIQSGVSGTARELLIADALIKLLAFFLIIGLAKGLLEFAAGLLSKVVPLFLLGPLNRLGGALIMLLDSMLNLVLGVGMLTPVVLALSYNLGGGRLYQIWQGSKLIAYLGQEWLLFTPLLKSVFRMI